MPKRLPDRTDQWNPEPPHHTQPWGGWTTHEILSLRRRLHDLQSILEEVTDELDRRALMIEAEAKSKDRHIMYWLQVILSSPTTPYLASLVVLLLTMLSNNPAAIDLAKELLRK